MAGGINVGTHTLQTALPLFLMQIIIIIGLSRVVGALFRRYRQPTVVAEIITGIILGPTVLGQIPDWINILFAPKNLVPIQMTSQLGLIFYMFIIGLELDLDQVKMVGFRAAAVSTMGLVMGCILAVPLAFIFDDRQYYYSSTGVFIFYMGIVLGISALPVVARILSELGLLGTPFGNYIMACKIVNDIEAWPLIALAVTLSNSGDTVTMVYTIPVVVADVLILIFVLRPLMKYITKHVTHGDVPHWYLFSVIFVLIIWAFATEITGLTGILGALELGLIMPRDQPRLMADLMHKFEDITVVILLPLYFAASGLKTDLTLLKDGVAWGLTVLIIAAAFATMMFGSGITAYLLGQSKRDSLATGVLMTTKGLVALVAINYGLDGNVITAKFFSMCAVMIVFTTSTVVPLLHLVRPMTPRRQSIASGSARPLHAGKTAVLCMDTVHGSVSLVSCSRLLCSPEDQVTGLRLLAVTERPTDFAAVVSIDNDPVTELASDLASLLKLNMLFHGVSDVNPAHEAVEMIRTDPPELVMVTMNAQVEANPLLNELQSYAGLADNVILAGLVSQHLPLNLTSVVMCVSPSCDMTPVCTWLKSNRITIQLLPIDTSAEALKAVAAVHSNGFGMIEPLLPNEDTPTVVKRAALGEGLVIIGCAPSDSRPSTRSPAVSAIMNMIAENRSISALMIFNSRDSAVDVLGAATAAIAVTVGGEAAGAAESEAPKVATTVDIQIAVAEVPTASTTIPAVEPSDGASSTSSGPTVPEAADSA